MASFELPKDDPWRISAYFRRVIDAGIIASLRVVSPGTTYKLEIIRSLRDEGNSVFQLGIAFGNSSSKIFITTENDDDIVMVKLLW